MKRTPLKRRTPLRRGAGPRRSGPPGRKPMKRSIAKRCWTAAREKVRREGRCRGCGRTESELAAIGRKLEAAHVIGREHDKHPPLGGGLNDSWSEPFLVDPTRIIPLCGPNADPTTCHGRDHAKRLDTLPLLELVEQIQAVADAGGVEAMRLRTMPSENPKTTFQGVANL